MKNLEDKTYYEILRVERDASVEAIKAAYHEIAKVYHPDSNFYDEIISEQHSNDSVEVFKLITDAYNTLINPERRAEYDQLLPPEFTDWDDTSNEMYLRELYAEKKLKSDLAEPKPRRKTARFGSAELRAQLERERKTMQEVEQIKESLNPIEAIELLKSKASALKKDKLSDLSIVLVFLGAGLIVGALAYLLFFMPS